MLLYLLIGIIAIFPAIGCNNSPDVIPENTQLEDNGGGIVDYPYTKAQIEAEVEANWREYGYSTKPSKYIAVSFDDGPCGVSANGGTAAMLAKLEELNVKATFFVIGQNVNGNKDAAKAIFNAGHELGNHSNGYASLGGAGKESIASSLDAASQAIKEITGNYPRLFRAPNLSHGADLSQACQERGMSLIDGTVHNDWPGNAAAIKASVLNNPQDGDIIVLHENNTSQGNTMSVLGDIIGGLREKGFWILPVGQLAAVKEKNLEAGVRYGSIK